MRFRAIVLAVWLAAAAAAVQAVPFELCADNEAGKEGGVPEEYRALVDSLCELQLKLVDMQQQLDEFAVAADEPVAQLAKRKNEFIRFGKKDDASAAAAASPEKRKNEFIRFGKRKNEFIRFGKRSVETPEKRKNEFIRFGKRKNEFIRFGKRKNEFIRFGKRKNEFIRFGKKSAEPTGEKRKNEFIRFG